MSLPPLAAITAFHVVGGLTALWAVVLAGLGLSRHDFPGRGSAERIVLAISALLVVGSIATAIGTATTAKKFGGLASAQASGGRAVEGGQKAGPAKEAPAPPQTPPAATKPAPAGGGPAKLSLSADPSGALKFNTTTLSASAGQVQITLTNPAPLPHNISLEGNGVSQGGATVAQGKTSTLSATLKPGTYTFFCSVPGHRQGGMQGTLTVR
ncbi:MAG: hypothetical protein NVSMB25_24810 [Thermoleophilaceae bacterium]